MSSQSYTFCKQYSKHDIILRTFSKYIKLDKHATVRIIGNKYNPTQKSFNRFIFEKTNQTSKECPFQINQTSVKMTFCNNAGYYRELYGNYLEHNCSWIESPQNKSLPAHIYRRTLLNCDENIRYFK